VAIGNFAGYHETGSNKLYIANSTTTTPLIYGEFDNQLLRANGIMQINKSFINTAPVLELRENTSDYARLKFSNTATTSSWVFAAKPAPNVYYAFCNFNFGGMDILSLYGDGGASFVGNLDVLSLYEYSDENLKEAIVPLSGSLQGIRRLNSYNYFWKDRKKDSAKQYGFMAQEVEKVFPELVHTNRQGIKSVSYTHFVPILLESVKEQQVMIDEMKLTNQKQQDLIESLVKRIEALERK
jgi:hypothetical protein